MFVAVGDPEIPFITLVEQILDLKNPATTRAKLENRIDEMVYDLYDLTPDEIAIVEGN